MEPRGEGSHGRAYGGGLHRGTGKGMERRRHAEILEVRPEGERLRLVLSEPLPEPLPDGPAARRKRERRERLLQLARRTLAPSRSSRGPRRPLALDAGAKRRRVTFVLVHAYGLGTVRTVVNTANALAERGWQVEVLSLVRRRTRPIFPVDRRVRVRVLLDIRDPDRPSTGIPGLVLPWLVPWLARTPSVLGNPRDRGYRVMSLLTDVLLVRALRSLKPGVLVTTRPALNLIAARFAPARLVLVGQEHINLPHHRPALREEMRRYYPRLDALAVLTEEDVKDYRALLAGGPTRVVRVPNAVTPLGGHISPLDGKVVVALGRLMPQKGYDLLLRAFRQVADPHPDWQLRIYGRGPRRRALERLVRRLALEDSAFLLGRTDQVGARLGEASVYALSSRYEGLPMVLLEAMSVGLPPVAFDCPTGPREVLTDGHDGILVPAGDVDGLARGICDLIEDPERRRRMATAARATAAGFELDRIAARWEELFVSLGAQARTRATGRPAAG